MTDHVRIETAQGIMSIRFNRPEKKNALTQAMYAAAADAMMAAAEDNAVRARIWKIPASGLCW